MAITSISTASTQQSLAAYLEADQSSINQLSEQLATNEEYTNLTDYAPSDALNLMNLQNSATQSQAYLSVITTVQARLSGYDTTLSDMESITSQAQTLANGNASYDATTATSLAATATSYLKSVGLDLNQQINGRYIYGGSRYGTAPVQDPSTLSSATLSPAIYTDGSTLPAYDVDAASGSLTLSTSGQNVALSGTPTTGQTASVTVGGTTYSYTIQSTDTTAADVATGLANTLTTAGITGSSAAGTTLTVGGSNAPTAASSNTTSSTAYAIDQATVADGDTVSYGVSSDNPAFQQLIAGLRYIQAAGNSTDATTYKADMTQASTLLSSALIGLQTVNTAVAGNINLMTNETATQNTAINDITSQVSNIQSVNITQVSTEITAMTTQLQASYTVTGDIERMSLAQYL